MTTTAHSGPALESAFSKRWLLYAPTPITAANLAKGYSTGLSSEKLYE
jgi:hypothetical protein